MADIESTALRLGRLLEGIQRECQRRLEPKLRSVDDHRMDTDSLARLEHWQRELRLILRDLRSSREGLGREARALWDQPRDQRYRTRQSLADRSDRLDALIEAASRAIDVTVPALEAQMGRRLTREEIFTAIDDMRGFTEALVSMSGRTAVETIIQSRSSDGAVLAPGHSHGKQPADLTVALSVLYTLIRFWLLEKTRQRQAR